MFYRITLVWEFIMFILGGIKLSFSGSLPVQSLTTVLNQDSHVGPYSVWLKTVHTNYGGLSRNENMCVLNVI